MDNITKIAKDEKVDKYKFFIDKVKKLVRTPNKMQ